MVEDARTRTIAYIKAYETPTNITKDNDTTQAKIINQFEKETIPLLKIYFDPKNVDGIRTIYTPTSTALPDWKKENYAYHEIVPIDLQAVTKQGINSDKLRWKMETDLRATVDNNPLGSVRLIRRAAAVERDLGRFKINTVRYDLDYKRPVEDYTSDVALSYGTGYYNDGSTLGSATTGTASGGTNATLIDAVLTEADDYWNGAILQMLSGSLAGGQRPITNFDQGSFTLTFAPIFGAAVVNTDTYRITTIGQVEDGNTVTTTVGSEFTLLVTATGGNFAAYISLPAENAVSNLSLNSTLYSKIRWRYKTGGTNKAKIVLVFSTWDYADSAAVNIAAGKGQEVLPDSSSSTMTEGSATITTGKTIDHIRLHADHGAGADSVYYDWVQICAKDFPWPNCTNIRFTPSSRNINLGIPSGMVLGHQNLGADPARIELTCDLDMETTTYEWIRAAGDKVSGVADKDNGEVFLDAMHNQSVDAPWQWLTWGNKKMRIVIDDVDYDEARGTCIVRGFEFSDSNKADETYSERYGI